MAVSKTAKEKELSELHVVLAKVLATQVGQKVEIYDENDLDAEGMPKEGTEPKKVYVATPALLTVAARFLKDNDITCEIEESEGASELRDQLQQRRRRKSTLASILPLSQDEEAFGN